MLKRGQRLSCPVLQCGVVAALRVTLEQRNGILVSADLHGIVLFREILVFGVAQLAQLFLVGVVVLENRARNFSTFQGLDFKNSNNESLKNLQGFEFQKRAYAPDVVPQRCVTRAAAELRSVAVSEKCHQRK